MLALLIIGLILLTATFAHPLDTANATPQLTITAELFQNASTPTSPSSTSPPAGTSLTEPPGGSESGDAIPGFTLGTSLGGIAGGLIIVAIIVFWCRARKRKRLAISTPNPTIQPLNQPASSEKVSTKIDAGPASSGSSGSGTALDVQKQEKVRPLRPATTM